MAVPHCTELHTTSAFSMIQPSLHTVPHTSSWNTSTRPEQALVELSPLTEHLKSDASLSKHKSLASHMGPVPWPNCAMPEMLAAFPHPRRVHTTSASDMDQSLPHKAIQVDSNRCALIPKVDQIRSDERDPTVSTDHFLLFHAHVTFAHVPPLASAVPDLDAARTPLSPVNQLE
ncbi:hypothetical protein CRUP_033851, partial [Coryphaenoides rupestris]